MMYIIQILTSNKVYVVQASTLCQLFNADIPLVILHNTL